MTEQSVTRPTAMMPGRNGGFLRRGGGSPAVPKDVESTLMLLRRAGPAVARALIGKALKGNVRAQELVLAYVVGKPADRLELTGADGGPVQFFAGWTDHERDLLREAIDAQLVAGGQDGGATLVIEAGAAVVDAGPSEPAGSVG